VWPRIPGTLYPLADCRLADALGLGNLTLRPALLLQVPGLKPSSVLPVLRGGLHPRP
jgi:hypothetical protein